MADKSIVKTNKSGFCSLIPKSSDEEIISILKKRKQYQPEAAQLAIGEAIKRGLINSEQDLFSDRFSEEPAPFSLFPAISNEKNKNDIRKSIARIFFLIGAGPVIWGFLQIIKSAAIEGILLVLLGSVWLYASFRLMRAMQPKMVTLLFLMSVSFAAYTIKLMVAMKGPTLMDIAIPVTIFSFMAYGLLFINRLK